MGSKETVTSANENAIITDFLKWYNDEYDTNFEVESRPDPPDAILCDRVTGDRTWIELTNAYYSKEWARDLHTHATPGRENYDMGHSHADMDKKTGQNFVINSINKLVSTSYDSVAEQYGKGILVVVVFSPWFNGQTVEEMVSAWIDSEVQNTSEKFGSMYYGWQSKGGYDFCKWELLK